MHTLIYTIITAAAQLWMRHGVKVQSVRIDPYEWSFGDWAAPSDIPPSERKAWLFAALNEAPRHYKGGSLAALDSSHDKLVAEREADGKYARDQKLMAALFARYTVPSGPLTRTTRQQDALVFARTLAGLFEGLESGAASWYVEIARFVGITPTSHEIGVTQYDSAGKITRWGDKDADQYELHNIKIIRHNIVGYEAYPDKPPVLTDAGDGTLKFTDPGDL